MISKEDLLMLSKFPHEWRPCMMELINENSGRQREDESPLSTNNSFNETHRGIDWKDFIDTLLEKEPSVSASGELEFVCRFQLLSDRLQTGILTSLHVQQGVIPKLCIETLLSNLEAFTKKRPWLNLLCNSLRSEWNEKVSCKGFATVNKNVHNPWTLSIQRGALQTQEDDLKNELSMCSQHSEDSPALTQWDGSLLSSQLSQSSAVMSSQHSSNAADLSSSADQLREAWFTSSGNEGDDEILVRIFTQHNLDQVDVLCSTVELHSLSEQQLGEACHRLEKLSCYLPQGVVLICAKHLLLSKVSQLDQLASRTLSSCALSFAETFPTAFLESVLIPVALASTLSFHKVDLLLKVLKQSLQETHKTQFLEQFLEKVDQSGASSHLLPMFHHVLDSQCPINATTLSGLLNTFHKMSEFCLKTVAFGKLLLILINKYGPQLNPSHKMLLQLIANSHQTFMKKSALSALNKL